MKDKDTNLLNEAYNRIVLTEASNVPLFNSSAFEDYEDEDGYMWQDYENEFVIPIDFTEELNHEELEPLIHQAGAPVFTVKTDGIDPSVDGTAVYYTVSDQNALKQIAAVVASSGDQYIELASDIASGKITDFAINHLEEEGTQILVMEQPRANQSLLNWLQTATSGDPGDGLEDMF